MRLGQHSPFSFRITLFLRQVSVRVCVGFPEAKRRMRGGNVHPGPSSSSFVCRKPRGYIRNHKRRRLGNHIHRRRVCNSRANRFQPFFSGSFSCACFFFLPFFLNSDRNDTSIYILEGHVFFSFLTVPPRLCSFTFFFFTSPHLLGIFNSIGTRKPEGNLHPF